MLNRHTRPCAPVALPARQSGVVLMIALIILVAMTIGGLALVRSVDTTNLISGNLAFRQAAARSAEAGTERAMQSFIDATISTTLWNNDFTRAYTASTPVTGNSANWWDGYWASTINPGDAVVPGACSPAAGGGSVCVLPTEVTGNTVSYTIHRLCQSAGDPALTNTTGCARGSQPASGQGSCFGSDCVPLLHPSQYFYRITTRVAGPRNTSSYVQTIVAR